MQRSSFLSMSLVQNTHTRRGYLLCHFSPTGCWACIGHISRKKINKKKKKATLCKNQVLYLGTLHAHFQIEISKGAAKWALGHCSFPGGTPILSHCMPWAEVCKSRLHVQASLREPCSLNITHYGDLMKPYSVPISPLLLNFYGTVKSSEKHFI